MTESEWLTFNEPDAALRDFLAKAGERKLRLFACASCRQIWHLLDTRCREGVETAERLADGVATDEQQRHARLAVATARGWNAEQNDYAPWQSAYFAAEAVQYALGSTGEGRPYDWSTAGIAADKASIAVYYEVLRGRGVPIDREIPPEEIDWEEEQTIRRPSLVAQCDILRDLLGNPFRTVAADPSWLTPAVVRSASSIYSERAFDRLPSLAEALEAVGCKDKQVLDHCRSSVSHFRGCWVIDRLLGKE
jgi:hypothetical protein